MGLELGKAGATYDYGNDPTMQIRARGVIGKVPLELQVPS